jgi:hypothetical protein
LGGLLITREAFYIVLFPNDQENIPLLDKV